MEYVALGNTGLKISKLAMGGMNIFRMENHGDLTKIFQKVQHRECFLRDLEQKTGFVY